MPYKDREKHKLYNDRWRQTPSGRASVQKSSAHQRAKQSARVASLPIIERLRIREQERQREKQRYLNRTPEQIIKSRERSRSAKAKEATRKWSQKQIDKNYPWLCDIKSTIGCLYCGEFVPECLDFHHVNPASKLAPVSRLIRKGLKRSKIWAEIIKCVLVCANCHRKIHCGALEIDPSLPSIWSEPCIQDVFVHQHELDFDHFQGPN